MGERDTFQPRTTPFCGLNSMKTETFSQILLRKGSIHKSPPGGLCKFWRPPWKAEKVRTAADVSLVVSEQ